MVSSAACSRRARTEHGCGVARSLIRAVAVADRRVTGLSREVLAELVTELGPRWQGRQDARLVDRPRQRLIGAGPQHRLVFTDRLLARRKRMCGCDSPRLRTSGPYGRCALRRSA